MSSFNFFHNVFSESHFFVNLHHRYEYQHCIIFLSLNIAFTPHYPILVGGSNGDCQMWSQYACWWLQYIIRLMGTENWQPTLILQIGIITSLEPTLAVPFLWPLSGSKVVQKYGSEILQIFHYWVAAGAWEH